MSRLFLNSLPMIKSLKCLFSVCLLFTFISIQAQYDVGATVGVQVPTGNFADGSKLGFGINLVGKYMLKEHLALGLNLGYQIFGVKDLPTDVTAHGTMVPITALVEYYLGSGGKVNPYVGIDLGLYNVGYREKSGGETFHDSKTYFGIAPTGGIQMGINEKVSFCANLKYNIVFAEGDQAAWVGINAGLIFKIK
jgi:outer membrane protein W